MRKILAVLCLSFALISSGCQSGEKKLEQSESVLPSTEIVSEITEKTESTIIEKPEPPSEETDLYETDEYISRSITSTEFSSLRDSFSMLCYANPAITALTRDGNVVTWGFGYKGTIGNGIIPKDDDPDLFRKFTPYLIDFSEEIVSVGNDSSMAYALTDSGDVFVWGDNSFGECGMESCVIPRPQKLKIAEKIEKVSIGTGATWVFLTKNGRILVSGIDILTFERLEDLQENIAFERDITVSDEYTPIMTAEPGYTETELPFRCKDIACGLMNYAVLSEEGEVYVLGTLIGDYDRRTENLIHRELYKIEFPEKITEIESGSNFIVALSESGKVYLYGKQEGIFFDETRDAELSENLFLKGALEDITSVKCHQYCVLAIDRNGDLWGFGIDQWGALDIQNADMDTSTYEIIRHPRKMDYSDVIFCDADTEQSVILMKNGQYYVQGASSRHLNDPFDESS